MAIVTTARCVSVAGGPSPNGSEHVCPNLLGPFFVEPSGQIRYVVLENCYTFLDHPPIEPNNTFSVFKSTNYGKTYAPIATSEPYDGRMRLSYPGSGNILYFAYCDFTTHEIKLIDFAMGADSFGAINSSGSFGIGDTASLQSLFYARLSNDIRVVCISINTSGAPFFQANWLQFSGGSWNGFQAFGNREIFEFIFLDAGDRIHFFTQDQQTNVAIYHRIWNAGSVSIRDAVLNEAYILQGPIRGVHHTPTDTLLFPLATSADVSRITLLSGTPSYAPVWTLTILPPPALSVINNQPAQIFLSPDQKARIIAFYGASPTIKYIFSLDGITWSGLVTYFDESDLSTINVPPFNQFLGFGSFDVKFRGDTINTFFMILGMSIRIQAADANASPIWSDIDKTGPRPLALIPNDRVQAIPLPDPRVLCCFGQQKKCVTIDIEGDPKQTNKAVVFDANN